jgi:hypothetical protein
MFALLLLDFDQDIIQTLQALLPNLPILLDPIRYLLQFLRLYLAVALPSLSPNDDQPTFRENLDVFRNRRSADVKVLGDT